MEKVVVLHGIRITHRNWQGLSVNTVVQSADEVIENMIEKLEARNTKLKVRGEGKMPHCYTIGLKGCIKKDFLPHLLKLG